MCGSGNINNDPVPPTGAGRSIGVVAGYDKTLRPLGSTIPGEMRRTISTRIPHPVEHLSLRHSLSIFQIVAPKAKAHDSSSRIASMASDRVYQGTRFTRS